MAVVFLCIFGIFNKNERHEKIFNDTRNHRFCCLRSISTASFCRNKNRRYQHTIRKDQFIEGNIGMDFGYSGKAGFKATAIYNFVWARPAWTERGSWALYAGPGLSIGGVNDLCVYKFGKERIGYTDSGFMFAFAAQVGLEYNFDFPLQLALDVRPYFGVHVNDGVHHDVLEDIQTDYGSTAGFYDNGLLGFVPTISVRYRF